MSALSRHVPQGDGDAADARVRSEVGGDRLARAQPAVASRDLGLERQPGTGRQCCRPPEVRRDDVYLGVDREPGEQLADELLRGVPPCGRRGRAGVGDDKISTDGE